MRVLLIALTALAAACSPPAEQPVTEHTEIIATATAPPPPEVTRDLVLGSLRAAVSQEVGQPVSLQATTVNVRDEWAYVVAQPRKPDGSAIDWSTTTLAQRAADGVLDGDGQTFALLKNVNGAWEVLEYVVGPTDVAHIEWAGKHGVPPDLLGLPSN
jgi:hypothetical protein